MLGYPQLHQKWICSPWRPVGAAASSCNRGLPRASALLLPSPRPVPPPQFQNPQGPLASGLGVGLGFISRPYS